MATQKQDGLYTDSGVSVSDLTGKEFYFAKRGASGLDLCGADEVIAGVISEGRAIGKHTSINIGGGWLKVIAGSAITLGDSVASDADGKAKTGSTNPFGKARNSAAAGEYVEVIPDRT